MLRARSGGQTGSSREQFRPDSADNWRRRTKCASGPARGMMQGDWPSVEHLFVCL
jgi:hypothetical protein